MTPIGFNQVPANFRVPFFSTEFASANNLISTDTLNILVMGQMLSSGTATPNVPIQVVDPSQCDGLFGHGSMLSEMVKASLKANSLLPTWALPVSDNGAGVAASGSIAVSGPATAAGTLAVYVGGVKYQVAVASADTADTIATNLQAALSADSNCFVTATIDGSVASKVDIVFKHKGLVGNYLDVRANYSPDDAYPAGVSLTFVALSGGTSNPTLTAAISGMGETQYNSISAPWTDATSLSALEAELEDRWGAIRQIDGKLFTAANGSFGTVSALGESRNSKQDSIMDMQNSPSPIFIMAAVIAAVVAGSAQNDPALPYQTLALPGILPPALADQRTLEERNLLLFDGISTFKVVAGGQVVIERIISTYETNAEGAQDQSYLSMEKLFTLSEMRFEYNNMWATKYPRFKLGQDGTKYGPGQKIVTPKIAKAEIVALYGSWCDRGLASNPTAFAQALIVEPNGSNPDRLDVSLDPQLMDQLRMVGTQINFLI